MNKQTLLAVVAVLFAIFSKPVDSRACGYDYVSQCATELDLTVNGNFTYFYIQNCTWMTNFNSYNFGTVTSLSLTKGLNNTWESCDNVVMNATLYYRIYPVGGTPGSFTALPLSTLTLNNSYPYRNRIYENSPNTNLLAGLATGNYTFEVYYRSDVDFNLDNIPDGELLRNNGGLNYKATFNVGGGGGGACAISNAVSNIQCNTNGTPSNAADDTYSFNLTVNGTNASSGWNAVVNGVTVTGTYGTPVALGPYLISNGNLNFTVRDNNSSTCTTAVSVTAPPSCSNTCSIAAQVSNITCNNNGTATNPADDTYTFSVNITGSNTGAGWHATINGVNQTGTYGTVKNLGPYAISSGVLNFTVIDNTSATCTTPVSVTPPATCSNTCSIAAQVSNITCNNNGTATNPADDTYTFSVNVTGSNTGAGWHATVNGVNQTGTYGTVKNLGPYAISSGVLSFTVIDNTSATCTTPVSVTPPATCSNTCSIAAQVSNITCNNNGTATNPADDTYTFSVNVTGSNTGTGWHATVNGVNQTGTYGTVKNLGPYAISSGVLNFTVIDNTSATCTTPVSVTPPATCSNTCSIAAQVSNITCNNNGTATNPADDTYTFSVNVTGSNTGSGWSAVINGITQTGTYGTVKNLGPYAISSGVLNFTVIDNTSATCTTPVSVTPPATCSNTCSIAAQVSNITCNNNGTATNSADDTYTFSVNVTGSNTGSGWSAVINGITQTGTYGTVKNLGPYAISSGVLNFTVIDNTSATCTTPVSVTPPATCSNTCSIAAQVSNITCNNNGTATNSADDTYTFSVNVTGSNTGTGWSAVINGVNQTGTYGTVKNLGPYAISSGVLNFTVIDNTSATCTTPVSVTPPATCSNTCSIAAQVSNITCNNNGTATNSADDTYTFSVNVTGSNTGAGWHATINGVNQTGTYGTVKNLGPYAISSGVLSFTVIDNTSATCTTPVSVTPPATCSNSCSIAAQVSNITCNNNGTATNPADDTYTFSVNVTGSNTGSGWHATINGVNQTGTYGTVKNLGPYAISSGVLNFTVIDNTSATCTTPVSVTPPATCSTSCGITSQVSNVLCNNNGTASNPTDDTFTFTVLITGNNTSTGWHTTINGVNYSGAYGTAINLGPYPISIGNVSFTVVDNTTATCSTPVSVLAPATCSQGSCNKSVLFVVGSTALGSGDLAIKNRLVNNLGASVQVIDDDLAIAASASGKDLVIISSTVSATVVGTKFRDVAIPVLTWERDIFANMKMTCTSSSCIGSQGGVIQVQIQNAAHQMAGGQTGNASVYTVSRTAYWGNPAASAIKVGSVVGNSNRWLVWGYETGSAMVGINAPARRAGFFLNNTSATGLTTAGWAIFDGTYQWMVGCQAQLAPQGTDREEFQEGASPMQASDYAALRQAAGKVVIYPNPVYEDAFSVDLVPYRGMAVKLEIYNLQGNSLFEVNYDSEITAEPLPISAQNWPDGVYFLKIVPENLRSQVLKFVIDRR